MKRSSSIVKLGLLQTSCSPDPAANLTKTLAFAARAAKQGARIICTQELFRSQYFCQSEDHENFELAEPIPGPSTAGLSKARQKTLRRHHRLALREARLRPLPQHRRRHRRRRRTPRHLPQDAHPRRPALLREILFHSRRPRLSRLENPLRQNRRPHLLGPMVSRGRPPHRHAGRGNPLLSHRHRLASRRKRPNTARTSTAPGKLIQRSHAVANGCYVAVPNRVGLEKPGSAATASSSGAKASSPAPRGQILAKAGVEKEEILIVPVDLAKVDVTRTHWPFLRDRRIDAYSGLTKRLID